MPRHTIALPLAHPEGEIVHPGENFDEIRARTSSFFDTAVEGADALDKGIIDFKGRKGVRKRESNGSDLPAYAQCSEPWCEW